MNIDAQRIAQTHPKSRRRRLLGVTAGSAAALAGIVLAQRSGAIARSRREPDARWLLDGGDDPSGSTTWAASGTGQLCWRWRGIAHRASATSGAVCTGRGEDVHRHYAGAWVRMDDGGFGLTWVGFAFDDAGKFLATQRVRVAVQLNDTLDGFSGPFKTDFIGADGQVLASVGGTVQGTRIQIEPSA